MYQIVYLSRASAGWTLDRLDALAATSARRNGEVGVTGLLLFDGARFLQAIEGDEEPVIATMRRIEGDPGHDMIEYLNHAEVDRRHFGSWSMRFEQTPAGCCTSQFLQDVKQQVAQVNDAHLQAAFIGFAALSIRRERGYVCPVPTN